MDVEIINVLFSTREGVIGGRRVGNVPAAKQESCTFSASVCHFGLSLTLFRAHGRTELRTFAGAGGAEIARFFI